MRTQILPLIAVCALASLPAAAKQYPNIENRFVPMQDKASVPMTNDINVELTAIQLASLPEFVATQLATVVNDCFVEANVGELSAFSYSSEYNRQNRLPPNFLLDFNKLAGSKEKACIWEPVCSEAGCRVLGFYATDERHWEIAISPHALQWGVQPISQYRGNDGTSITRYELWTVSSSPQCETPMPNSEICLSDYAWSGNRLTPIKVNR